MCMNGALGWPSSLAILPFCIVHIIPKHSTHYMRLKLKWTSLFSIRFGSYIQGYCFLHCFVFQYVWRIFYYRSDKSICQGLSIIYLSIYLSIYISSYLSIYLSLSSGAPHVSAVGAGENCSFEIQILKDVERWVFSIIMVVGETVPGILNPKRVEEKVRLNCCTQKVSCVGVWCKQYKGEIRIAFRWLRENRKRTWGLVGLGQDKILETVWWQGER